VGAAPGRRRYRHLQITSTIREGCTYMADLAALPMTARGCRLLVTETLRLPPRHCGRWPAALWPWRSRSAPRALLPSTRRGLICQAAKEDAHALRDLPAGLDQGAGG